jgi:hypothetical protein
MPSLSRIFLLALCTRTAGLPSLYCESGDSEITAVAARVSDDYVRTPQADGSYPVEYYAFGNGGHYGGQMVDESVDKLKFLDVAHMIANPLAAQNYMPARDPAKTRLLIMVYWGLSFVPGAVSGSSGYSEFADEQASTAQSVSMAKVAASNAISQVPGGFHSSGSGSAANSAGLRDDQLADMSSQLTMLAMVNKQRDLTDFMTARLLGYDYDPNVGTEYGNYVRGTALGVKRDDIFNEIEANRYFVVLMAYDFQLMLKQKKHKLLWETRFSIRQSHHQFDRDLPAMARFASRYFGQDSHGLVRKPVPLGTVTIGDVKSLGTVEAPPSK